MLDLRKASASPPQTTMRNQLRELTEIGVLQRRQENKFPGAVNYALTGAGRDLLAVGQVVTDWLAAAPDGPLHLGAPGAKSVIKALTDGWSTNVIRALAARPLALTELASIISGVSYPSLERRLVAMRLAGQLEVTPGNGRGRPYVVTDWLRHAVAPLAAAAQWERLWAVTGVEPVARLDAEAAFLLAIPLVKIPPDVSGACRLTVEISSGKEPRLAGVVVTVEEGRGTSCIARLKDQADAWASGSAPAWLCAVIDHDPHQLEIGGEHSLAASLVEGLHRALIASRPSRSSRLN